MPNKIDRRQFLKAVGGLAATPFIPSLLSQNNRPNVLLFLMDDLTHKSIGDLNNPELHTPNIDRLCRQGTTFTHAFNQGSWSGAVCTPARSMLITGQHLWQSKNALENQYRGSALWGETFGKHGYETFFTGKWHLEDSSARRSAKHIGPHSGSFRRGMLFSSGNQYFRPHESTEGSVVPETGWMKANWKKSWTENPGQPWHANDQSLEGHWLKDNAYFKQDVEWINKHCPEATHASDVWTRAAIDFLKNAPAGGRNPFFMHLAYFSPHDPRQSPASYLNRYPAENVEVPPNFVPEFPFNQGDHYNRDESLAPFPRDPRDIQVHRQEYYALTSYIDHHIGRVLDTLEETGQEDNTIVIFTADHGLAVGQHGLMGKQNLMDHSVRVPLIMAGPGIPAGRTVDRMLYHSELFPTTCELADIPVPDTVKKQSFADLATGQRRQSPQAPMYGAYKNYQRSIRTKRHKLIEYRVDGQSHTQLFDLQENPWEKLSENLADRQKYAGLEKDLRSKLHEFQKIYNDPMDLV